MLRRAACVFAMVVATLGSRSSVVDTAAIQPSPARPNIVVILTDDLGYGDLASYGHPTIRTPRLDRLAQQGIRLTSYYSGSALCTPARAALLTGRYAPRVGLPNVLGPESTLGLRAGEVTLADALRGAGYQTMAIGKWHLGHSSSSQLPTAHGFDAWVGLPYSNDMLPPFVPTTTPLRVWRNTAPIDGDVDQDALTERYTTEATSFIMRAAARGPFFLYLAHSMPHLPVHASARFRGRSAAGLYGDVIEMLDWSTGELLDALDKAGVAGRTIVVFASDNGPWLDLPARMLQQGNEPWHTGSPGLLRGAKATTWEGGVRVPGIVRWPGVVREGQVSSGMAAAMDLFVTLATAGGAAPSRERALDGHDLRAFLQGGVPSPRHEFAYINGPRVEGVRIDQWKLRQPPGAAPELYQLELDPSERYNRADREPAIVARLRARMEAIAATLPSP
jgi:arylsulfatase A-like enzyme